MTAHTDHHTSTPHKRAGDGAKRRLLCRLGYAAHGVVYLLIGIFAVDAAFGGGGEQAQGSRDAVASLAEGTWGTVLLTVLALGLFGYSYLRLWQGIGNPAGHDKDVKGIGNRIGRVVSGLVQAALAIFALSIAYGWFTGSSGGGGSGGAQGLTARVLSWPAGQWIVGIIGVGICIAAFAQLGRAVKASFLKELMIKPKQQEWVKPLGRFGFASRFVVFLIVGGFVIVAAYQAQPGEARGLGGALRTLQEQPYGPWLLGFTGLGLIAFAITRGVFARYAVIPRQPG